MCTFYFNRKMCLFFPGIQRKVEAKMLAAAVQDVNQKGLLAMKVMLASFRTKYKC